MNREQQRPLPARLDPRNDPQASRRAAEHGRRARGPARGVVLARWAAAVLSALILAGSGWGWYLVRVAEASVSRTDAIPDTGNTDVGGGADRAVNLLLVGMDSRDGLTAEQRAEFSTGDPDAVLNTDSMMLVHLPADGSAASFVSLPRDTYVSIPGYGEGRLNSAYAHGYNDADGSDEERDAAGAQTLIRTVSAFSGLQIDHFAKIDLLGFINLSTIVGGVEVNLCEATRDPLSGADFPAGVQTISGADALAFVRQRQGLPRFDLDRIVRQQVYLAGMLRNILSSDLLLDLGKQKDVVEQVGSSVTLDQDLDLFDLAAQMQGVQPGSITFQTIPGLVPARIDGAEVLQPPDQQELHGFFASLAAPPAEAAPKGAAPESPAIAPGDVPVSVLNGSGVPGAAAEAAAALEGAGFPASSGGNADPTGTTTVRHATGDDGAAALVAGQVPGAALAVDDSVPDGTVQLVIGADFIGIGQAVTPQAPADNEERTAADSSCIN